MGIYLRQGLCIVLSKFLIVLLANSQGKSWSVRCLDKNYFHRTIIYLQIFFLNSTEPQLMITAGPGLGPPPGMMPMGGAPPGGMPMGMMPPGGMAPGGMPFQQPPPSGGGTFY